MARQIQLRRGTAAEHETFTGADGEVTVDTTNRTLRVHDGVTPGGAILARAGETLENADYVVAFQSPTADNGYTWYRKYKSGWVEQGGIWTGNQICSEGQEINPTITLPVGMSSTNYYADASVMDLYLFSMGQIQTTTTIRFRFGAYTVARTLTKFAWTVIGMAA